MFLEKCVLLLVNYEGFVGSLSLLAPNAFFFDSRKYLDMKHNCIIRFKCLKSLFRLLFMCFCSSKQCLHVSLIRTEVYRMEWISMLQTADLLCFLLVCQRE